MEIEVSKYVVALTEPFELLKSGFQRGIWDSKLTFENFDLICGEFETSRLPIHDRYHGLFCNRVRDDWVCDST